MLEPDPLHPEVDVEKRLKQCPNDPGEAIQGSPPFSRVRRWNFSVSMSASSTMSHFVPVLAGCVAMVGGAVRGSDAGAVRGSDRRRSGVRGGRRSGVPGTGGGPGSGRAAVRGRALGGPWFGRWAVRGPVAGRWLHARARLTGPPAGRARPCGMPGEACGGLVAGCPLQLPP